MPSRASKADHELAIADCRRSLATGTNVSPLSVMRIIRCLEQASLCASVIVYKHTLLNTLNKGLLKQVTGTMEGACTTCIGLSTATDIVPDEIYDGGA